jgi:hypothetical protein
MYCVIDFKIYSEIAHMKAYISNISLYLIPWCMPLQSTYAQSFKTACCNLPLNPFFLLATISMQTLFTLHLFGPLELLKIVLKKEA